MSSVQNEQCSPGQPVRRMKLESRPSVQNEHLTLHLNFSNDCCVEGRTRSVATSFLVPSTQTALSGFTHSMSRGDRSRPQHGHVCLACDGGAVWIFTCERMAHMLLNE